METNDFSLFPQQAQFQRLITSVSQLLITDAGILFLPLV
jgi:hypothetical protein